MSSAAMGALSVVVASRTGLVAPRDIRHHDCLGVAAAVRRMGRVRERWRVSSLKEMEIVTKLGELVLRLISS